MQNFLLAQCLELVLSDRIEGMQPSNTTLQAIRAHAAQEYPRESCGFIVVVRGKERYVPVRNIAEKNEHFVMCPQEQADAEDIGEVLCVVHSHPNIPPVPSDADKVGIEKSGLPWLIVNWPTGAYQVHKPCGYVPPLYGRQFHHGVLDCYTFIQQYYKQELGIELLDFERADEWWLKGQNLYLEGFEKAGFQQVTGKPKKHDVLLMRVASQVPNHGAVYLGDGLIGQHIMNRLSSKDVYGGWFEKSTTHILRHRSLL